MRRLHRIPHEVVATPSPNAATESSPEGASAGTIGSAPSEPPTSAQVLSVVGRPRRGRWQRWVALLATVALLGVGAVALSRWQQASDTPAFEYVTRAASKGSLRATVTATGTVAALDQVDVGAEVSGKVRRVLVDFNQRVERGQLLCEIDPETYQAAYDQAKAQLSASRADLNSKLASVEEARTEAERNRTLGAEGLVTQQQVVAAAAALKRAEAARQAALAQVGLARAALKSAETVLHKTRVVSPIDGIVLSRQVEPGQTVVASFQAPVLFTLAKSLGKMQLDVLVDEADIGQVHEGQAATFSVDAYRGRTFSATLSSIHNTATVQNGVVSYEAQLLVDNDSGLLRPGMTATVTITTGARDHALMVPNAALRFTPPSAIPRSTEGPRLFRFGRKPSSEKQASAPEPTKRADNQARVWVLDQGAPKAIDVETGLSDGKLTELVGGHVKPGTPVIVDMTLGR